MLCSSVLRCVAAMALAIPAASQAATLTVGSDSSCDFLFVEQAVSAAEASGHRTEIRLARNARHVLARVPSPHARITLRGGYSQCFDHTALGTTTLIVPASAVPLDGTVSPVLRAVKLSAHDDPKRFAANDGR